VLEGGLDQAAGLRRLFARRALRVLPLAGGDESRAEPAFVLNLAAALARAGWRPIVVDGQRRGLSARLAGEPALELADLLEGQRSFESVVIRSPEGFSVLPAACGLAQVASDPAAADAMFGAIAAVRDGYDIALVHANPATLGALLGGHQAEPAVVCGPAERDLTAAYARLKALATGHGFSRFRVVFDRAPSPVISAQRHRRLAEVADRFLSAAVAYGGAVAPHDDAQAALRARASVFSVASGSGAARSYERLAAAAQQWTLPAFESAGATIH
jgi:flagellar biosynthesis protein FlhG